MMVKQAKTSDSTATVNDEVNKVTLLSLPDGPLLRVLSLLTPQDLLAAGRTSPRLAALTRAHPALWRGKSDLEAEAADELADWLRSAPPAGVLELKVLDYDQFYATYFNGSPSGAPARLKVEGGMAPERADCLVRELAPGLQRLEVSGLDLDMLFAGLYEARRPRARCLEVLSVCTTVRSPVAASWPQFAVLPRLHTLQLYCDADLKPDCTTMGALRSLLRAHSGQLRSVTLGSELLLPLLYACPDGLQGLALAAVAPGVAAALRRMQALRELDLNMLWSPGVGIRWSQVESVEQEVEDLLMSWPGRGLRRLTLSNCRDGTVRALSAGALAGLEHLELAGCFTSCEREVLLQVALQGLPRLRSLAVRDAPPFPLFDNVRATSIPALELLVVTGAVDCARSTCARPRALCPAVLQRVSELRALVRRAPSSLHAVLRLSCCSSSTGYFACFVIYKHPHVCGHESPCTQCDEAIKIVKTLGGAKCVTNTSVAPGETSFPNLIIPLEVSYV